MNLRIKTIITFSLASVLGTSFLWAFNIFYVLRNWSLFWDGFALFFAIVGVLIILSDVVIWFVFIPAAKVERKIRKNEIFTMEDSSSLEHVLKRMPTIIFITNAVGYLIGPLIKRFASALVDGTNPFNLGTLSTVIYSVAIGLYLAFIEIRLIEGYFLPLQTAQAKKSMNLDFTQKSTKRQYSLAITILILVFGLFFSAGQGYLLEELYAPGQLNIEPEIVEIVADDVSAASEEGEAWQDDTADEVLAEEITEVDTVSAASKTNSDRIDLWERALKGEKIALNANHPQIKDRLKEYTFKMFLLGLIAAVLSLLGVSVEAFTTKRRLNEMNERLREIGEGNIDESRKLNITRFDELGAAAHWINVFIDKQISIMRTVRGSINRLGETSEELGQVNVTAVNLGEGIEGGINKIKVNIEKQQNELTKVETSVNDLGETIVKTNNNLQKQSEAMSTNTVSMEEMTANIGSVSKNSQGAYDNTQFLITSAEKSSSEMNILLQGISEMAESASEVSKSVIQISNIAAQTNLLAMNAAIEAAHAGDVGAGFAVVASEVRKLAEDSSKTTKNITSLISKMNKLSGNGLSQADDARNSFNDIHERVKNNSRLIAEISESMKEQESGSLEMQRAMEMLKELSDEVSSISDVQNTQRIDVEDALHHLTSSAIDIKTQMDMIVTMMSDFDSFISTLGTVIKRNAVLVEDLKKIPGV